jgi:hypothetical protein
MSSSEEQSVAWLLLDYLAAVEGAARAAREKLQRMLEEQLVWQEIKAPKPLDANDRALAWLKRKVEDIRKAHPELKVHFVTNPTGQVTALRFSAPNGEVADDIESVSRWAFEKAASRPQAVEAPKA